MPVLGKKEEMGIDPDIKVSYENNVETWEIPAFADTTYLSHAYFRYIGKFPPQIPRAIIRSYSKARAQKT